MLLLRKNDKLRKWNKRACFFQYVSMENHITLNTPMQLQLWNIKWFQYETIESLYDISPIPTSPTKYGALIFIRGFAKGKKMPNTLKALALSERLHEGQKRKCGDPFIIHPLRVASYLISLKIYDDATIAASLLHEVFKHCDIKRNSDDLVSKYGLDPEVLELIRLVSKPDNLSNEEYYSS